MSKYKAWIQKEVSSYGNLEIGQMEMPQHSENEILVKNSEELKTKIEFESSKFD